MMKYIFLISLLSVMACSAEKKNNTEQQERVITVTMEPLRFFVEAIVGDKFKVVSIVPKGSSPETYDPTPEQLINLNMSEAYFRIGYIGFEQVWMDKLTANVPSMKVFDTSEGVNLIKDSHHHHHEDDDHHTHKVGIEPHIWNSPINAMIIAGNVCKALSELDGENSSYYTARFDSLKHIIHETDSIIKTLLNGSGKSFLIYHPALSYFARDYGLNQISIEEGGKQPSPAQLKSLIDLCRKEQVGVVFVQQEFDTRNAELIAKETNTEIIPINPLSYDWKEEMIKVAQTLSKDRK